MPISKEYTDIIRDWVEISTSRSMEGFKRSLEVMGVTFPQVNVLMHLYFRGGSSISQLGCHLSVTNAAASQIVDKLVQMELLERTEDPNDRRAKALALTEKGRAMIAQAIEARTRWVVDLTDRLTPDEQKQVVTALALLNEKAGPRKA